MNPSRDQVMSLLRWLGTTFGGVIAGWFAAKGWFSIDQVLNVINSPVVLGFLTSGVMLIIGLFVHSPANTVASANALPEVAGVITKPTADGIALANAVPSSTVVPAGTSSAAAVAGTR